MEGMEQANPIATPLDPNVHIEPNPDPSEGNRSNLFTRLLGGLQYITNATHPNITFAINRLVSYMANLSTQHYGMIKRVIRYLAGVRDYGITYQKTYNHSIPIIGYRDAAHANADKRKLTTGLVFLSAGGAVLWKSKQTLSALSTMEAEYVALAHAGTEVQWF
jgi:hypothetical protein